MTIQKAKDQVAQRLADKDWDELMSYDYEYGVGLSKMYSKVDLMDKVVVEYASEKVKEALQLAAERAEVIYHDGTSKKETHHKQVTVGNNHIRPNRGMILSLETELLNQINKEI